MQEISVPYFCILQLYQIHWMWSIFFGEFQCLPVNDCSAVNCGSSALSSGSESFYFTILNQYPEPWFSGNSKFESWGNDEKVLKRIEGKHP